MKILVIDNYDSFVYNLIYLIKEFGEHQIDIKRNDELDISAIQQYDKILLSPGPGIPEEAGQLMEVITKYAHTKDILGICLGHQALGQYFGMQLTQLPTPLHGISSTINIVAEDKLFDGLTNAFPIAHYHSWVVDTPTEDIEVLAYDGQGNITAFRHRDYPIRGLQFHPESILTITGKQIINNWLKK
ncbi:MULTISPECIES: anthranilate synthase component II [Myroides]|uniref:Aminodeoxychorismate/anthranilate synthase component II n=1 Tax=Myroides albus TaxID=2562892 RepID=A0A6I3LKK3_9FLAO|nr:MULTISPECIES: aminodeoxychorismate/anthranilate synthase component II [Myroides]MTG96702.1 aminodeoxychorismate/anthranilate synthase component II [Myroides albus]MVX34714.1 aminodeoxychorismate/anthranilate synthase component II [Myroides sp. LoEW2-1]UVD80886.1 aminodeoxychorismate/anthranilate synthase component II [Myroides albus]